MAVREIVLIGDPILRQKAHPVERFDPELRTLVRDMIETMRQAQGVGLAAPQVGVRKRVLVFEIPVDEDDEMSSSVPPSPWIGKPFALVNPEILEASQEMEEGIEGCLSIPGYVGEVRRHVRVVVQGRNEWGKPRRIEAEGFLARVLQHEIDHLNGILYVDRLESRDKLYKLEEEEETAAPA
ncbi:MAG: peptide deformylase [Ardenticatenia bacterium]|nr:peptide deformylase [Ardenticatenia bacterium]